MSVTVSVLVPIFGVEKYIEKCAHSLFCQTLEDVEYIFVNDCTRDRSIEILQSVIKLYPERQKYIKIVTHEQNQGLACARNSAILHASAKYLFHVDADDYIEPDTLCLMYEKAIKEDADIVVGDFLWQFSNYAIYCKNTIPQNKVEYINAIIARSSSTNVWGKLIKRSLYITNKLKIPKGFNYGEDYFMYPRLVFFASKITYIPQAFYHYVQYNTSSYIKNITESKLILIEEIIKMQKQFFLDKNYENAINIARLKLKVTALFHLSNSDLQGWILAYNDINFKKYREYLSFQEFYILKMSSCIFFIPLLILYRFFHVHAGMIKRKLKNAISKFYK